MKNKRLKSYIGLLLLIFLIISNIQVNSEASVINNNESRSGSIENTYNIEDYSDIKDTSSNYEDTYSNNAQGYSNNIYNRYSRGYSNFFRRNLYNYARRYRYGRFYNRFNFFSFRRIGSIISTLIVFLIIIFIIFYIRRRR